MAIGSVSNDWHQRHQDHCIFLDSPSQAHRFCNSMMNRFLQFATEYQPGDKGEDRHRRWRRHRGVELSAELWRGGVALRLRLQEPHHRQPRLTLVEQAPHPAGAARRISNSAHQELVPEVGVDDVRTATAITKAAAEGLHAGWGAG